MMSVRDVAIIDAVIIAGLIPIMIGAGTGSEVMQRIAAPVAGGMVTAPLLSMSVVPAVYLLMRRRATARSSAHQAERKVPERQSDTPLRH